MTTARTNSARKHPDLWKTACGARSVTRSRNQSRTPSKGIEALLATSAVESYVGHLGDTEASDRGTRVLPLERFLRLLHCGEIIG